MGDDFLLLISPSNAKPAGNAVFATSPAGFASSLTSVLDDDDDEEMEMDTNEDGMTDEVAPTLVAMARPTIIDASAYAAENLFGPPKPIKKVVDEMPARQLGEAPVQEEPVVEVDEDGFAPVVKRKGRKN